jgi:hypothetical protein
MRGSEGVRGEIFAALAPAMNGTNFEIYEVPVRKAPMRTFGLNNIPAHN